MALVLALVMPSAASAQQRDTTSTTVTRSMATAAARPPITPRRAFLYSLAVPGLGQTVLGRHRTAAAMLGVEAISIVMIRESRAGRLQAARAAADTVITSYVDVSGNPLGAPRTAPGHFTGEDSRARGAHVEDWIALLIANHLLAGAEAFVSAHLWDVRAQVGVIAAPGRTTVVASVRR
jgi:hypothetical protein